MRAAIRPGARRWTAARWHQPGRPGLSAPRWPGGRVPVAGCGSTGGRTSRAEACGTPIRQGRAAAAEHVLVPGVPDDEGPRVAGRGGGRSSLLAGCGGDGPVETTADHAVRSLPLTSSRSRRAGPSREPGSRASTTAMSAALVIEPVRGRLTTSSDPDGDVIALVAGVDAPPGPEVDDQIMAAGARRRSARGVPRCRGRCQVSGPGRPPTRGDRFLSAVAVGRPGPRISN